MGVLTKKKKKKKALKEGKVGGPPGMGVASPERTAFRYLSNSM